jgi:hypothetical protein
MTTPADIEVNRRIRRVFIKHWIDLGRLSIRSMSGRVVVYGTLRRITGFKEDLTPPIVESIFYEAKKTPGVTRLDAHLENWTADGGLWKKVEADRAAAELGSEASDRGSKASTPSPATE